MIITFVKDLLLKLAVFSFLLGLTTTAKQGDVKLCDLSVAVSAQKLRRSLSGPSALPWDLQNLNLLTECPFINNNFSNLAAYQHYAKKQVPAKNGTSPNGTSPNGTSPNGTNPSDNFPSFLKTKNYTKVTELCSAGIQQSWSDFKTMQQAFLGLSITHLSLLILRDIFLWVGPHFEKPYSELLCFILNMLALVIGAFHAKKFYDGYTYTTSDKAYTCMFHLEAFMPVMRFVSIIAVVLALFFDHIIGLAISFKCGCGPAKYIFLRKYTEKDIEEDDSGFDRGYGAAKRGNSNPYSR